MFINYQRLFHNVFLKSTQRRLYIVHNFMAIKLSVLIISSVIRSGIIDSIAIIRGISN